MIVDRQPGDLSLLGGPLHRLGCRLGLVRGGTNTLWLGLALGVVPWLLFVMLAAIEGVAPKVFTVALIGGHLRLLVVIPLFFLCESLSDPLVTTFARGLVGAGVVSGDARAAFDHEIARLGRWRDAWLPEAVCLLVACVLPLLGPSVDALGATTVYDPTRAVAAGTWAGRAYWFLVLPLFRFLLFRLIYRLGLWWHFLWRLSRLGLRLIPSHPDRAAGLGFLELVQTSFLYLVAAISVQQAGSLAEGITAGGISFAEIYPRIAIVLAVGAALTLSPLLLFGSQLWACKVKGLKDYMDLAGEYVNDFDRKWLRTERGREPLLGTADLQSLADLGNSVDVVRSMRWFPASVSLLSSIAIAALLPMLPLFLFEYPVAALLQKLISSLVGL